MSVKDTIKSFRAPKPFVPLDHTIPDISNGAFVPKITHDQLRKIVDSFNSGDSDAREYKESYGHLWDTLKVDRNACLSVCIDYVWQKTKKNLEGRTDISSSRAPFSSDLIEIHNILSEVIFNLHVDNQMPEPVRAAYEYLSLVEDFNSLFSFDIPDGHFGLSMPEVIIMSGVGTAVRVAAGFFEMIDTEGDKLKMTPHEKSALYKKTMKTIAIPLAMEHKETTVPLLHAIERSDEPDDDRTCTAFNPDMFVFERVQTKNGTHWEIDFSEKLKQDQDLKQMYAIYNEHSKSVRTQCPGMYKVDGRKGATIELLALCCEVAERKFLQTPL